VTNALIKAGADVNVAKADGWTALMLAAGNNHP
jgi:ankyrin repeat protein